MGSLALSQLRPSAPTLALRSIRWHEGLERLGLQLPFFMVHDIGMLFAAPKEQFELVTRVEPTQLFGDRPQLAAVVAGYKRILEEIGDSEASRKAGQLKLNDDLVIIVLARLMGAVAARVTLRPAYRSSIPVDASIFERIEPQLGPLFRVTDRSFELATLDALGVARLFVVTLADALDTDTLRLFGMLGAEGSGALSHVDLLSALESPEANDVVNFSLEILPSVLETKTRPAAGTTAAFGYSGLGTRGSIDSMVLSELAWDDIELTRRLIDNEVLYFAREQSRDETRRIHILLIDASASMRGDRQTFARGMALATGKKLVLEGEEVAFRFFDSRLYETTRAKNGLLPTAYLLSFKGERGRNPARVFAELATDLDLLRHRDARAPVVHLFTHAALYIPREMVEAVRALAHIAAVFILPSGGKLDLDYLDLLNAHWVVDHATLQKRDARNVAAKSILDETHGLRQQLDESEAPMSTRGSMSKRPPASRGDAMPQSRATPSKGAPAGGRPGGERGA